MLDFIKNTLEKVMAAKTGELPQGKHIDDMTWADLQEVCGRGQTEKIKGLLKEGIQTRFEWFEKFEKNMPVFESEIDELRGKFFLIATQVVDDNEKYIPDTVNLNAFDEFKVYLRKMFYEISGARDTVDALLSACMDYHDPKIFSPEFSGDIPPKCITPERIQDAKDRLSEINKLGIIIHASKAFHKHHIELKSSEDEVTEAWLRLVNDQMPMLLKAFRDYDRERGHIHADGCFTKFCERMEDISEKYRTGFFNLMDYISDAMDDSVVRTGFQLFFNALFKACDEKDKFKNLSGPEAIAVIDLYFLKLWQELDKTKEENIEKFIERHRIAMESIFCLLIVSPEERDELLKQKEERLEEEMLKKAFNTKPKPVQQKEDESLEELQAEERELRETVKMLSAKLAKMQAEQAGEAETPELPGH